MVSDIAWNTIVSPVVLSFVLGLLAALARSNMSIPEESAKGIAIYLARCPGSGRYRPPRGRAADASARPPSPNAIKSIRSWSKAKAPASWLNWG